MDEIDRANKRADDARDAQIKAARDKANTLDAQPTGACLWCDTPLTGKRWCDADCRDMWQRKNLTRKR